MACKVIFVKQRDALVELTAMDSQVLNLTQSVKYSQSRRAEIQRQLTEQQYISDYTATGGRGWTTSMCAIMNPFSQLTGSLEQVISGDQPLQRARRRCGIIRSQPFSLKSSLIKSEKICRQSRIIAC